MTLIIYSEFNLYYNEKIQNYQSINNVFLNLIELQKEIDLLESIFIENKYKLFFSTILNKEGNKINKKIFKIPKITQKIKVIPLINNNTDTEYDYDNKILSNNKYFAIFYFVQKVLYIYDINVNIINIIELEAKLDSTINIRLFTKNKEKTINDIEMIQYESNILLIYYKMKFIFIFFSNDFKKNEIIIYNSETSKTEFSDRSSSYPNFRYYYKNKLIKINEKDVCLLLYSNIYLINFNDVKNNIILDSKIVLNNIINKIDEEFVLNILPISYKDNNNNIIKEMISLSYTNKTQKSNNKYFFEFDDDYYYDYFYDNDLFGKKKGFQLFNKYKYNINIYSNNLTIKDSFTFNYSNNLFLIKFLELNYNYINNMLLIFVGENILQISLKTKQIITNYIIQPLNYLIVKIDDNLEEYDKDLFDKSLLITKKDNKILKSFQIFSFYNYNENIKKMEQIILLKDCSDNKIYPYYWDDKTLLFKQNYELPKFIDIIEFNKFGENTYYNKKNNSEKIFIESEEVIIFK